MNHRKLGLALFTLLAANYGAATAMAQTSTDPAVTDIPIFRENAKILFQGDSITDMARGRSADPNHILGHSYVFIIAGTYGEAFPERKLVFINRGIGGNKVSDLAKRWQGDTLDIKPDILSILIGVNDLNGNVSADQYEQQYDKLLTDTQTALPHVRLILCEPFGLPTGNKKDGWETYHAELVKRQEIVRRLADKHGATFVALQKAFEDACQRAPADYWIWDGVHPTYSGQRVLAKVWIKAVSKIHS